MNSVLLVDDEPEITSSLSRLLRRNKLNVHTANCGKEALDILAKHSIDVVLSDQCMPEMTGSELLAEVSERYPETVRMILSGYSDFKALSDAINNGRIFKFLAKPWDNQELLSEVGSAINFHSLQQHNTQLNNLVEYTREAIIVCDNNSSIQWFNPSFNTLTGYDLDDIINKSIDKVLLNDNKENFDLRNWVNEKCKDNFYGFIRTRNQELVPISFNLISLEMYNRESGYALSLTNRTKSIERDLQHNYCALHDELTGLPNRSLFNRYLEHAIHRKKQDESNFAVMSVDLDGFNKINELFGYEAGNEILREVTLRLCSVLKNGEILARYKDNKFCVLFPAINEILTCVDLCRKVLSCFRRCFKCEDVEVPIRASVGIYFSNGNSISATNILFRANSAMYDVKLKGGDGFSVYKFSNSNMDDNVFINLSGIHRAIKRNEFVIRFQPKYKFDKNEIPSCQALAWWQNPERGLVSLDTILHLAEKNNLVKVMNATIFECLFSTISNWLKQDIKCRVSISVSEIQFYDDAFVLLLEHLIFHHEIPKNLLSIEVCESTVFKDIDKSSIIIPALRVLGVSVTLKNFHYPCRFINRLDSIPLDGIKIDNSLTRDIIDSEKSRDILVSILIMARRRNLKVIANNIESDDQMRILHELGVDIVQGSYVSRPLEAVEFINFYTNNMILC